MYERGRLGEYCRTKSDPECASALIEYLSENLSRTSMKHFLHLHIRNIFVMFISIASVAAFAQEQPRWVKGDNVLLREGPDLNQKPIGTFERGALLTVGADASEQNGYCKVTGYGVSGFMACKYVSADEIARVDQDATLPGFIYAESVSDAVFLQPTTTHVGETPLKPGKGWLALVPKGTGWELVSTELQSKRVDSSITLYDVELTSDRKDAIAFIRLPGTKAGAVVTPFPAFDPSRFASTSFSFGPSKYRIYVKELRQNNDLGNGKTETIKFGELHISSGNRDTALGLVGDGPSDSMSSIKWLGDLDGDGKLDVITDDQGSNSGGACLHLSGAAKGKELFGPAICHIGTGC